MMSNLQEFYDYVLSFYGADGLYPMGATFAQVKRATSLYVMGLKVGAQEFCGDSIDRECVRDLLISKYGLSFPPAPVSLASH
jgi:hypothetical protein